MVMQTLSYGYDVTSVSNQAEVVSGPQPRRGPPKATGDSHPSCARGGQSKTTGIQEKKSIKIMHWIGIRSVSNRKQDRYKDFQFEPQVKQDNFIVVGDFNSHSPSWGYKDLDSKGEKVEDWAIDNQLVLLNRADDPPTFTSMTWRTSSTPDIAFATDDIQGRSERSVES
ncbi:hypothetical protein ElyMa_001214200 [Elysia marginata]|uniref:Endonuclease/exonuclease/phosphatase domain-containing protein n=1 Tax=Elysia marginata TaxID=1093978 RepID=A0AAV4IAI8_9GAST|nr:hypothetical protein ElyMa_001214200 [Elysia marginata]